MAKKLETRVDLRTDDCQPTENADAKEDQMKAMQERLDKYIQEFVILNVNNKNILKEAHDKFNKDYEFKLQKFNEKIDSNLKQVQDQKEVEEGKTQLYKSET